jgi:hypothetical protein
VYFCTRATKYGGQSSGLPYRARRIRIGRPVDSLTNFSSAFAYGADRIHSCGRVTVIPVGEINNLVLNLRFDMTVIFMVNYSFSER